MSQEKELLEAFDSVNTINNDKQVNEQDPAEEIFERKQFFEAENFNSFFNQSQSESPNKKNCSISIGFPMTIQLESAQFFIPQSEKLKSKNFSLQLNVYEWLKNINNLKGKFFDCYSLSKEDEDQTKQLLSNAAFELSVDNNEKAIEFSLQILKKDRLNIEAIQILGQSFVKENLFKIAELCYELVISIIKKESATKKVRALTLLGSCLRKEQNLNESLKTFLTAKKILNKHLNRKSNSMLDDELDHFPNFMKEQNQLSETDDFLQQIRVEMKQRKIDEMLPKKQSKQ